MKPILHHAIRTQLQPSVSMLGLLICISIICCWILLALPLAFALKLAMLLLVIASSLYFILRDALLLLPWSWQALEVDGKGQLRLRNRLGQQFQPVVADSTLVHAQLTIINFKRKGCALGLPPVILLANPVNRDAVRRIRVWLRWSKQQRIQHQGDLTESD